MEAKPKEDDKPRTYSKMTEQSAGKGDNLEKAASVSSAETNQHISDPKCPRNAFCINNNITVEGEIQNFSKIHIGLGLDKEIVKEGGQQMGPQLETLSNQEKAYSGNFVGLDSLNNSPHDGLSLTGPGLDEHEIVPD
ncbi:hypothetical protein Ancab_028851, partial [Ancistrocladus abbreviatus]